MLSAKRLGIIALLTITVMFSSSSLNAQTDTTNCCDGIRGNINGDTLEQIDISDLIYLVESMFNIFFTDPIICSEENDVNGDGSIDISDLVHLVAYMFNDGPEPDSCDLEFPLLIDAKVLITMEEVVTETSRELHLNYTALAERDCHFTIYTQLIMSGNYIYVAFDSSFYAGICVGFHNARYTDNLGELANSTYSLTINNGASTALELKVTPTTYEIIGTDPRQFIIENPILNKAP